MKRRVPVQLISLVFVIVLVLVLAIVWRVIANGSGDGSNSTEAARPVPVEVAAIENGRIELHRLFSGTLESMARFNVAPKVGGRIERLAVDLADEVANGDIVATLDSDEFEQAVSQAEADLAVAEANLAEAESALEIADRSMQRQSTLLERGVASDAQFDTAKAEQLAAAARVKVARAQVTRALSSLESARIRLGYTQVRTSWREGDDNRVVAERYVDEGDTVAANTPLLSIIELDPIQAVLYVAERDYARLQPGQSVGIRTDAFPGEVFGGEVARVSPVFETSSRQARVELSVPNPDGLLKPGMFIRAEAVLDTVENAVIVPDEAIVKRADQPVVFRVDEETMTVRMVPVEVGITHAGRTQVSGEGLTGRVVTLGQQLLDDGSEINVTGDDGHAPEAGAG